MKPTDLKTRITIISKTKIITKTITTELKTKTTTR